MDGTIGASAVVPVSYPSTAIIVPTQATDVDPAPIPVAVQLQTKFWTSCTKCGIALEYLIKYCGHLLWCPYCCGTFEATEKSLASIIGQIDSSVLQAPNNNDDVAAEGIEAQLAQGSSVPKNFQHKSSHHGVSMRSALHVNENGSIMEPRHSKRKRQNLSEAFGGEYKIKAQNKMEQIICATNSTMASASPHDKVLVTVDYYPVVYADNAALVAIPVQIPDPFWTSCDKCGFQFEYEFKYRDLLVKCPHCYNPFLAKEIPTNYKGSRTVEMVSRAHDKKNICVVPSEEVAAKKLEVLQPIGGNIAFMKSGEKRKMKEQIKPPCADYKPAQDEYLEKSTEPQGIQKKANHEDVVAELQKIPDLAHDDFIKAYHMLTHDNMKYRILVEFPMELKKKWLEMQIQKQFK